MIQTILLVFLSIITALFATIVMSYIGMAVPIGPWVEATLVLLLTVLAKIVIGSVSTRHKVVALATAAGGIAGIAATGCAFSFPALYFLDKEYFYSLMATPAYFSCVLGGLVFCAGAVGLVAAFFLRDQLIERQPLSFPIGAMVEKIIVAQDQSQKSRSLLAGGFITMLFLLLQQPIIFGKKLLPKVWALLKERAISFGGMTVPFKVPSLIIQLSVFPMLIAIGYVAGHMVAIPLSVGAVSKILILEPLQSLFFTNISWQDFVLAFCSGMVLEGVLMSFAGLFQLRSSASSFKRLFPSFDWRQLGVYGLGALLMLVLIYGAYMQSIGIPVPAQLFLLAGTLICCYQLALIGGKIGLAPLGRYATFVMVPGILLFGASPLLATVFATFVEVAGGVTVDSLFGYKSAQLLGISKRKMASMQWVGLLTAAISIGFVFYILVTTFGLGSSELFAQKAQTRALLLNAHTFNLWVVLLGALFGWILKNFKLNPMFVLTGILMPLDYSCGLIMGGLIALSVHDTEKYSPFFSGMFCANSLWIAISAFFRL